MYIYAHTHIHHVGSIAIRDRALLVRISTHVGDPNTFLENLPRSRCRDNECACLGSFFFRLKGPCGNLANILGIDVLT